MDTLVVVDAGSPIPQETRPIDLALSEVIPSFIDTVRVVLPELQIEVTVVAEEMLQVRPEVNVALRMMLGDVTIETVKHTEFKERTRSAK